MKQCHREMVYLDDGGSKQGFDNVWAQSTLFQTGQFSAVQAIVFMIFHGLVYFSFKKRLSLWSCPSSNMVISFVGLVTAAMLPKRRKIWGKVSTLIPEALMIAATEQAYLTFGQIGIPQQNFRKSEMKLGHCIPTL